MGLTSVATRRKFVLLSSDWLSAHSCISNILSEMTYIHQNSAQAANLIVCLHPGKPWLSLEPSSLNFHYLLLFTSVPSASRGCQMQSDNSDLKIRGICYTSQLIKDTNQTQLCNINADYKLWKRRIKSKTWSHFIRRSHQDNRTAWLMEPLLFS